MFSALSLSFSKTPTFSLRSGGAGRINVPIHQNDEVTADSGGSSKRVKTYTLLTCIDFYWCFMILHETTLSMK